MHVKLLQHETREMRSFDKTFDPWARIIFLLRPSFTRTRARRIFSNPHEPIQSPRTALDQSCRVETRIFGTESVCRFCKSFVIFQWMELVWIYRGIYIISKSLNIMSLVNWQPPVYKVSLLKAFNLWSIMKLQLIKVFSLRRLTIMWR